MKAPRQKVNRKTMTLYASTYGFRQPYQVLRALVDADFLQMAASRKIDIAIRLEATLHGRVRPMISQCSVDHLYARGQAGQAAVLLARTLERRRCNHWQTKKEEADCIAGLVGDQNNLRYCIVTQSGSLRESLRKIPGTPLLYINSRSVLLLELPSEASLKGKTELEDQKRRAPPEDIHAIETSGHLQSSTVSAQNADAPSRRSAEGRILGKSKRTGNPNPLSVLKKKKKSRLLLNDITPKTKGLRMLPTHRKVLKGIGDHEPIERAADTHPASELSDGLALTGTISGHASHARKKRKRGRKTAHAAS